MTTVAAAKSSAREQSKTILPWVETRHIMAVSALLHLALLLYAQHVDTHPERYGGLKYTDVDWRVVIDGARHIWQPSDENDVADGWIGKWFAGRGVQMGDPYNRATFRYTPILPLLLSSALINDLLGKVVLSLISLAVPLVLLSYRPLTAAPNATRSGREARSALFWPVHLLWTLNPIVLNVTTRGSPEAIVVLIVVACFACLRIPAMANEKGDSSGEARAAVLFALAVSFKIYPVIYTPTIWAALRARHGLFGKGVWRFGVITATSLIAINGALWLVWGQPFLQHTYLYHLSRIDHRHNFSPYFYSMYLTIFSSSNTPPSDLAAIAHLGQFIGPILRVIRNPLVAFVPQATLVLTLGWTLEPLLGIERTAFLQTATFVVFNKVCTSQYFVWFIPLIPAVIADSGTDHANGASGSPSEARRIRIRMTRKKAVGLVAAWVLGQAAWLGSAYRLELLAQDAFLQVWACGIFLFGISVYILGELLDYVDTPSDRRLKSE